MQLVFDDYAKKKYINEQFISSLTAVVRCMNVNGLRMKTGRLGMDKKEEESRKVNEIIIIMA